MEENFRDVFVLVSGGDALGFMGFRRKMSAVRRVAVPTQKEAFVIWALSVRGVGESATSEEEPTQDKACNLGRFLDSLRSLGMTYTVGFTFAPVVPTMLNAVLRLPTAYGGPPSPKGKVLGGTVHPHRLYSGRCMAMNHRRYSTSSIVVPFGWYGSIVGTSRAAGSR